MNNLTLCVYAVSHGHWEKKDCYLKTIQDLDGHNVNFFDKIAHIKIRPGEEQFATEMEKDFIKFGYRVLKTVSPWRRWHFSHHTNQLQDIFTIFKEIKTDYIFHVEDDWVIRPLKDQNLEFYLQKSIELLQNNSDVIQVRIPRQIDELPHFKSMEKVDGNWKKQNEIFSLNPHVISYKDLRQILNNVMANQEVIIDMFEKGMLNVELLFAEIIRQIKGGKSLWSHSSENIRALHIGNKDLDDTLEKVY